MRRWWRDLDRILRGEATGLPALKRRRIEIDVGGLSIVLMLLAMFYGVCMGSFALLKSTGPVYLQVLSSTLKVPALFFLTLLVTFPSLYVFNALVGSRLELGPVLRLLVAALAVMVAVLASLGPIVAFFAVSTTTYAFMKLLNVAAFGVSGTLGLIFLLRTLERLSNAVLEPALKPELTPPGPAVPVRERSEEGPPELIPVRDPAGALDRLDDRPLGREVRIVFRCWVVLFGLVGAQMSWVLRPFLGDPASPFVWFRSRESNFFEAVWRAIVSLFS